MKAHDSGQLQQSEEHCVLARERSKRLKIRKKRDDDGKYLFLDVIS